jgi:glycosyltransferase involved in cell wall biosynthesis
MLLSRPQMVLRDTGIVVIARNEGERLKRCLLSCKDLVEKVVFSDSGSSDGSAEFARSVGVEVVELDKPYNQPRGRNAGFKRLLELVPDVKYVFFMDGDCQIVPGFLEAAHAELDKDKTLGAVCGRRLEIHPDASVYNRLVHMEWNTELGESDCGGDMLIRVEALKPLEGYREMMVSGEDFELCHRLRKSGWRIYRMDRDMTLHDVAIHRFGAWWKRHRRGGYSFAHAAVLNKDGFKVQQVRSILTWGLVLPAGAFVLAPVTLGTSLAALGALEGVLWYRVRNWRMKEMKDPSGDASVYALYIVIGKFAETQGVIEALWKHFRGRSFSYYNYKDYQKPKTS